ncbi:DUF4145 domain-containing protein [Streptomyces acidiscabies]|uniref:DUF4145 domain-containing protein n=1 Tax=Streptomyces acidiscabies TaxID=42234 RepID=UPI0038F7AE22
MMASQRMNMDMLQARSLGSRTTVCPHPECAVGVAMSLRDRRQVHPKPSYSLIVQAAGPVVYEELWSCDLCGRGIIELVGFEETSVGDTLVEPGAEAPEASWRRQLWPEPLPRELPADAPEMVRALYAEASRAESTGAYRLAGVGYRAVVEEICKDRGATGNTLYAKITDLANQGLPQDVVDAMHDARVVGNDSVHQGVEYAADEIADLAEILAEVVELLYVQPAKRKRMSDARAARSAAAKTP